MDFAIDDFTLYVHIRNHVEDSVGQALSRCPVSSSLRTVSHVSVVLPLQSHVTLRRGA